MTRRNRRGGNAIEFGLVMPFLVFVLAACVDYSVFFFQSATALQAMREGARAGSVADLDVDDAEADCEDVADAILATAFITTGSDCVVTASTVTASIDHTFVPLFNYSLLPLPDSVTDDVTLEFEESW